MDRRGVNLADRVWYTLQLSLHLTMAEKCMALFEKKKLPLSASVEQCCATGVTPEGKTPKTLVEEMVPLLDDRSVSSTDKLRIIAMYIMHRDGVPEGDKKRLYQHARLALHEMDAVNNLTYLGVAVSKDSGKKRKALFKQREEEDAYDISRYQPLLKYMLEEHFAGTLDQTNFPYVRDAPVGGSSSSMRGSGPAGAAPSQGSLRSARPQWTSSRVKKVANEPRQRVMVFVAGGMTYSEVRAAYKVSEAANKDIFIGQWFMRNLATLAVTDLSSFSQVQPTSSRPLSSSRTCPTWTEAPGRRWRRSTRARRPPTRHRKASSPRPDLRQQPTSLSPPWTAASARLPVPRDRRLHSSSSSSRSGRKPHPAAALARTVHPHPSSKPSTARPRRATDPADRTTTRQLHSAEATSRSRHPRLRARTGAARPRRSSTTSRRRRHRPGTRRPLRAT